MLLIAAVFGAVAGQLRQNIRIRWPHTIDVGIFEDSFAGFYVDELTMPVLFSLVIWVGLGAIDSAFFYSIIAWPFMVLFAIPVYALWACCHTGVLGWLGTMDRQQYMESVAYEVLISSDEAQRWLGALEISADPTRSRYVLRGVLPNRSLLTVIKRRLQSTEDA